MIDGGIWAACAFRNASQWIVTLSGLGRKDKPSPAGRVSRGAVACNVLNLRFTVSACASTMIVFSGSLASTNLAEIVRMLVQAKQTGHLTIQDIGREGMLAMESGMIVNARADSSSGMHALFELVGWQKARFEYREQPLPADLSRDLSVYEPGVLLAGMTAKVPAKPTVPVPLATPALAESRRVG